MTTFAREGIAAAATGLATATSPVVGPAPSPVVACAADRRYALPLAVTLRSAADALRGPHPIEAHVFDDGIDAADRVRVEASLDERVVLRWVRGEPADLGGLPLWGRMSPTTYRKLTLARWLPGDVDRVLWLDCDVLVLGDLGELWRMGLDGLHALGVQDAVVPRVSSRFGVAAHRELALAEDAPYFNAGVLLCDVAAWRRDDVAGRALDYLRRFGDRVYFWDQEALNAVLAGRWGRLDAGWNWNPTVERLAARRRNGTAGAGAAPRVVHFSGNLKPWSYDGASAYHELYYRALDRTAWSGWRPARTWWGTLVAAYESSRLRRVLYPAEQLATRLVRAATRRHAYEPGG